MPNHEINDNAPEAADFLSAAFISACYASHCRFNVRNACVMRKNEIGRNGQCVNFEIRKPEHVRQYLEARGDLTPDEIARVMAKVEEKEASDVPH